MTDSYKLSHHKMYEPDLEYLTSYLEARVGGEYSHTVFFGLQYILNEYFHGPVVDNDDVKKAYKFAKEHFGNENIFNIEGWQHIIDKHGGCLPIKIRAVPEGTVVPEGNVMVTVENTDPAVPWLTNHIETVLSRVWYPTTVATASFFKRKLIREGLERSADNINKLPFMLHDFGARGATSAESASIGGAAHLLSFLGTDNMEAIMFAQKYYDAEMAGYSVPASEHSTITSWGQDREADAYKHILNEFPEGVVSVVSDSWDIFNACRNIWGNDLRDYVIGDGKRVLVIRPDSGKPEEVVPECLNILGEKFGGEINSKGYAVLPPYIRLIQGDGITRKSLPDITEAIMNHGWSLDNVVFGSGGDLQQNYTRDTSRFAFKASAKKLKGDAHWQPVFKSPSSDPTKNSKKGYLYLSPNFTTTSSVVANDLLRPVFRNGEMLVYESWDYIKERMNNYEK